MENLKLGTVNENEIRYEWQVHVTKGYDNSRLKDEIISIIKTARLRDLSDENLDYALKTVSFINDVVANRWRDYGYEINVCVVKKVTESVITTEILEGA